MNAVTTNFAVALRHPSARLSQRLRVWVGILEHDFDVVKFRVRGGFCKDYTADVTVTSSQLDLDGKEYVGRRAGLQIDERVAVPSVSYVDPVDHEAATFNGVITRIERINVSRDEATYRLRIEPRFAALCKRIIRSNTFKDVTLQEMIRQALVDRKNFDTFDVEFQIEGLLEKMEQVVMYVRADGRCYELRGRGGVLPQYGRCRIVRADSEIAVEKNQPSQADCGRSQYRA